MEKAMGKLWHAIPGLGLTKGIYLLRNNRRVIIFWEKRTKHLTADVLIGSLTNPLRAKYYYAYFPVMWIGPFIHGIDTRRIQCSRILINGIAKLQSVAFCISFYKTCIPTIIWNLYKEFHFRLLFFFRTGMGAFAIEDIDSSLCTHGMYAFALIDSNTLEIMSYDPWWVKKNPANIQKSMIRAPLAVDFFSQVWSWPRRLWHWKMCKGWIQKICWSQRKEPRFQADGICW